MKVALAMTVGTTAEPLIKALEETAGENGAEAFLLYGRGFSGQARDDPVEVAHRLRFRGEALGVEVHLREAADPEDLDACLIAARKLVEEAVGGREGGTAPDVFIANITGGTKPLSAALVLAALEVPFGGKVSIEYIGGERRDGAGRVLREAMSRRVTFETRTGMQVSRILTHLGANQYQLAIAHAESFPDTGWLGFLKQACEMLMAWDVFDYGQAATTARKIAQQAPALDDHPVVAELARWVGGVCGPLLSVHQAVEEMRRQMSGEDAGKKKSLARMRTDVMPFLVADLMENASRRRNEGRFSDCVLRSYRAVECGVQVWLLAGAKVNPWWPRWEEMDGRPLKEFLARIKKDKPPEKISLGHGLALLELHGSALPDSMMKHLREVQDKRNKCFLEHGYLEVERKIADDVLSYAAEIIQVLFSTLSTAIDQPPWKLEELRARVRHWGGDTGS